MTPAPILALDIGTTAVKVGRFRPDGSLVGPVATARHRDETAAGIAGELDPFAVLAAAERGIRMVGVDGVEVVATSSVWHALVAVDAEDDPVGPAVTWEASRPPEERDLLVARLGTSWSHELSGGYLHPSHAVAALPHLLERSPHRVVDLASWVTGRLAGTAAGWPENIAAGSGLWLSAERRWNDAALAALGVRADLFGETWAEPFRGEPSIPELRGATWLAPAGDGLCHNLGQAAIDGRVAVTVGTSGSVRAVGSGSPFNGPGHGVWRYRVGATTVATGGAVTSAGNVLEWVAALFGRPVPWELLDAERLASLPASDPSVFGRRGPDYAWSARGALSGLGPRTTADDIQLAFAVDIWRVFGEHLAALRAVLPTPVTEVVVEGGVVGAAPAAAQLLADALGTAVGRTAEAQPSLSGAARLAGAHLARPGAGVDDVVDGLRARRPVVPIVEVFAPRPEMSAALVERWSSAGLGNPT